MTRDEAKALLQVYQHNSLDAQDPRFAEALRLSKEDSELAQWFAEEQAFNFALRSSLKATPVPPNLKMAILAGSRVLRHLAWWQQVSWLRVAALALIMLVGAGFFWFSLSRTQNIVAAGREAIQMAEMRSNQQTLQTNDLAKVREFLSKCRLPADFTVPTGMRKLPVSGCTLVGMQVQTAAVITFRLVGTQQLSLLVMEQIDDNAIPAVGSLRVVQQGDWSFAMWSEKGHTYMLSGKVHPDSLRRLLI